ncbi:MAG: tRNA (guanosine(37)-N1)-methyltransferase TrmD [Neomegalonema sp.]|nr:tRNA (guanosine(37)-N1)-methyltransferase TrmD [Neomegalonema sp.]
MGELLETGAKACPPWAATVLTLFPDMFPGPLGYSLIGRALQNEIWRLKTLDFRAFASDKHRSVDDTPSGGGPGLVLRADIAAAAIDQAKAWSAAELGEARAAAVPVLFLSPRGRPLTQAWARDLAAGPGVILGCGRFEGVDQRALDGRGVQEISVGDAVYTGGEIPAMAILDAVVRLLPGVIGDPKSLDEESFSAGLLEHPQYTRPAVWEGRETPEVLLSGNHANIAAWRRAQAELVTKERRPDLWRAHEARKEQSDGNKDAPTEAREE